MRTCLHVELGSYAFINIRILYVNYIYIYTHTLSYNIDICVYI